MSKTVLILTDKEGWHFTQIKISLSKLNHQIISHDLRNLSIVIDNDKSYIIDKDNNELNPDYVIVRYIPGGTLEEIISYLNILKTFEINDIKVINNAENIEKTVDKSFTSLLLKKNKILTPKTYILNNLNLIKSLYSNKTPPNKLIYKPMFGSQGDDIQIINNLDEVKTIKANGNIFYIQEFIEIDPSHDYRVLAIKDNNKYLMFSMTRYGTTFLNNYSKGAKCEFHEIDENLKSISEKIIKIFDIDFCGIDFIKKGKKYYTIEINSIPAWKGIQSVHEENIADQFVKCMIT